MLDYQQNWSVVRGRKPTISAPGGVCRDDGSFEVIDGQQRFTTLSAGQLAQTSRDRFGGYELVSDHQPRF
nr:DUF262 domain-containing protein [Klebsiella pneumoniae subsp. pneumoniae]